MPTVTITKGNDGKAAGLTAKDDAAFSKFRLRMQNLTPQESITFTWREPRSGPFHRRHFAMINALFESQEQFDDGDHFRKWLEVGAGYCDLYPGPRGKPVAVPKSIAYEKLDQAEFEPIHKAVFDFVRSEHARRFLWGHLEDEQSYAMVDAVLREFE